MIHLYVKVYQWIDQMSHLGKKFDINTHVFPWVTLNGQTIDSAFTGEKLQTTCVHRYVGTCDCTNEGEYT